MAVVHSPQRVGGGEWASSTEGINNDGEVGLDSTAVAVMTCIVKEALGNPDVVELIGERLHKELVDRGRKLADAVKAGVRSDIECVLALLDETYAQVNLLIQDSIEAGEWESAA